MKASKEKVQDMREACLDSEEPTPLELAAMLRKSLRKRQQRKLLTLKE